MLLLLAGCGSPHDTRPPRSIADEVRVLRTVPTAQSRVELVATLHAVDHPPRTAGWEGSEIGPVPSFGTPESMEAWVEVRARIPGLVPVIVDQPEPRGYLLHTGTFHGTLDEARADLAAATVTVCQDGTQLALQAILSRPGDWVRVDLGPPVRFGQELSGDGDCAAAFAQEPVTWHPTAPVPTTP